MRLIWVLLLALAVIATSMAAPAPGASPNEGTVEPRDTGYQPTSDDCDLIPLMVGEGPSRRQRLGLSPEPNAASTEERYGEPMTPAEARKIDELAEFEVDIRDESKLEATATSDFGEGFVGIRWDPTAGGYVVSLAASVDLTTDQSRSQISKDLESSFGVRVASVDILEDAVPLGTWEDQYIRLLEHQTALRDELSISQFSVDASCGHFLFSVDPDKDVNRDELRAWLAKRDPELAQIRFAVDVLEEKMEPAARDGNYNPHRGGQELWIPGNSALCTTSIPFYKEEPGGAISWWAITAGHCVPNQPGYVSGSFSSDSLEWWIGSNKLDITPAGPSTTYFTYGGQYDAAIVQMNRGGQSWTIEQQMSWGDISKIMNWWQWDPWNEVTGGPSIIGHTICQSGIATDTVDNCGELISKWDTASYTASKSGVGVPINMNTLRRVVGATAQKGDSGGTVWREAGSTAWYVGIVHGRVTGNFYYTHIRAMRDHFGLKAPANMW